jgi:pimeloyl-ACP methyl ester carboxylesterase
MSSVEAASLRLASYNPRLSKAFSYHLAFHGTRKAEEKGQVSWKFDPLHRTRGPQPFYLHQARAFWLKIVAPTLLVRGELSPFEWEETEDRECVQSATKVVINGAGHMVHHEQPERLAQAILGFLDRLPG